jgi:hypothetical protein
MNDERWTSGARGPGRSVGPVLAAAVLLAVSGCVPPYAFHDGLPAWSMNPNGVEWRVGYEHLSVFGADSFDLLGLRNSSPNMSAGYLTPGVRFGLKRKQLTAELGVVTAVKTQGGFSALFGGTAGLGYSSPSLSVMFRPSLYLVDIYSDRTSGTGIDVAPWGQATFLVGNGYRAHGLNFALGGRASEYCAGPVAFVGYDLSPVDLRAELSYLVPTSYYAFGSVLTVGLTLAAPSRPQSNRSPDKQYP